MISVDVIEMAILFTFSKSIVLIFTNIEVIQEITNDNIWLLVMVATLDFIQGSLCGIIKALDLQTQAMFVNLVTYYVLALPIGYTLVHNCGFKLEGLWFGFAIGLTYQIISYFCLIQRSDWETIKTKSVQRRQSEKV